ncbi:hypothetical protein B0T26DRAFT_7173 [Lasiosphaeria miniovina]|uniref:C2H2-type domain-containing protein n=1 Tax=Lasiosphaeria miniovina TaxID=1954250 RepID=A0AA40BFC4_9PEZI|nr:uncharacterized protein B0T26DRAFT_7173 [Lasiosphaeria miniovina]KAK0733200.1 hypothetical protein B0T26DRAFT_7173 [Lasiosphaeria miniovina]
MGAGSYTSTLGLSIEESYPQLGLPNGNADFTILLGLSLGEVSVFDFLPEDPAGQQLHAGFGSVGLETMGFSTQMISPKVDLVPSSSSGSTASPSHDESAILSPRPGRESKFRCCGGSFKNKAGLSRHKNRYHNKRFPCPHETCTEKLFGTLQDRNRHLETLIHRGKKLQCDICGKYFGGRKDNLGRHVKKCRSKLELVRAK